MNSLPLNDLGQQIRQLETQLKTLRGEFQTRQETLKSLQHRKEDLQAALEQVEGDIRAAAQGQVGQPAKAVSRPSRKPPVAKKKKVTTMKSKAAKAKPQPSRSVGKAKQPQAQPALRVFIIGILKKSRKPLRTKELAERALAAGYQTKSKNFPNVVQDLLKRLRNVERVPNEGYLLKRGE